VTVSADDRLQDRDPERGDRLGDARLLAAAHQRRHAPDDDAARDGHERVAGVDRLREAGP